MSEPVVEDLINITFSQTDNLPKGLHQNPHELYKTSNLSLDFNIDLNKTFDLNKCDEHVKAPSGIKTALEPFNNYPFECTIQEMDISGKLSQRKSLDRLESDESLGILPDLLKDEMTFDLFKTDSSFSDDEIHDDINPKINENPASFVFSPPSDNQFNRISLFLKNISTPLPNFGNDRRCSSTPKISVANGFVANTADIEHYSSPHFLPDEKEEPIAGSCHLKFETDFDLDDLKNVKPLTSTHKTFSPPRLSSIFKKMDEETDLQSEVSLKLETIENNLNVTQTFSCDVEDLFPCKRKDNIQNVNILNNTFQIKQPVFVELDEDVVSLNCSIPSAMSIELAESNNCSEKEKVKTLDSTFAIPRNENSVNMDCEKTFLVDFNSAVGTEAFSKSFYRNKILNETHVLEMNSIEFSSQQQEQIANVTFIKDLENESQTSLENCYSSHGTSFKPMTQILEETFSKNDLKPILEETFSENDLNKMLTKSNSQSTSPKTCNIKAKGTFSEEIETLPETKVSQNNYPFQSKPYSPRSLTSNIFHEEAEKNCFCDEDNLTENEDDSSNKMSFSVALQSSKDATFSQEIERKDKKIEMLHESDSTKNINSIAEFISPKAFLNTPFSEEVREKICIHDHAENEKELSNKILLSVTVQPIGDATFSEGINERAGQENFKLYKSNSTKNVNSIIEFASPKPPKTLAGDTFNEEVGGKISLHDQIKNECDPANKMSDSDPLQSIRDATFSETKEKYDVVNDKFFKKDSIKNASSCEMKSSLPKISKSLTFSNRSEVVSILESNAFQDSNDLIENDALNLQAISSRKAAASLNLKQCDNFHSGTNFSEENQHDIFTGSASEETEFGTPSISEGECSSEILPVSSNSYPSTAFSDKTDRVQSDMDSNEKDKFQLSLNSLKEITDSDFSEEIDKVQIDQISIPTKNDEFETSPVSQKEISAPFSGLADKDIKVKPDMQTIQCNQDSFGESSQSTKLCLKGTLFKKIIDKSNPSLKSCPLESKTVVKNGLIKPAKIAYPRKVSEQHNGQLLIAKPFYKPIIDKRFSTSGFNHTLNLSDNSTDKSSSKTFNKRLTLSCSSEIDVNKSKCKKELKKSFGIPSKLGIKRPESNFQKSRLDTKYSNEYLKDAKKLNDKQNLLPQPDLISSKDPKIVKSATGTLINGKGPISSRLSLHGKLPLKSLKMKECGSKSNTALAYTAEKSIKIISCPKVIDQPRKEKISEIGVNDANSGKNYSRHSIATNLPRNFLSFNNCNKTDNSKPSVIKQKSAPTSNSCKPDSLRYVGSMKLPNSIAKLKFSSFPKIQSCIKNSADGSESKSMVNKRPGSENQKPNSFLVKPCISKGEVVQTQSTGHVKQKDNARENNQPTTSIFPPPREQAVQPMNPLSHKKSNGQSNFLPVPKVTKCNIRSVNSNDVEAAHESQNQGYKKSNGQSNFLPVPKVIKCNIRSVNSNDVEAAHESHNQVRQQTSGRLPQLRRIPVPRHNK
ncbi:unnamed protein product [Larinioides sclopetarius]|uniref:Uncharacterized protein n=1 Tax=Larinioides sclopetarius TaxID=280406 RepID=A0AAV1ZL78_9ARAC